MEKHDPDPTTPGSEDPWEAVGTELGDLGRRLRDTYRRVADDGGPTEEEIRGAFSTLAGAWDQVAQSVGSALGDPEVRSHVKQAANAIASALGATITALGSELRKPDPDEEE